MRNKISRIFSLKCRDFFIFILFTNIIIIRENKFNRSFNCILRIMYAVLSFSTLFNSMHYKMSTSRLNCLVPQYAYFSITYHDIHFFLSYFCIHFIPI